MYIKTYDIPVNLTNVIDFLTSPNCWDGSSDVLGIKPDMSYEEAYLSQFISKRRQAGANGPIIGYQASLTSKEAKNMGPPDIPKPNVGTLQLRNWHPVSAPFRLASENHLVECEIAMRMATPLKGTAITPDEARKAVATVEAALEIVPLRAGMAQRSGQHLIATHNAGSSIVLSGNRKPANIDLVSQPVELTVDDVTVARAMTGASGGDPFQVLAVIANILGHYDLGLEEGMIIMTGSSTPPYQIKSGTSRIDAQFGELGAIRVAFDT